MALHPILEMMVEDPYPQMTWSQVGGAAIGSVGNDHYFQIGFTGLSFTAECTAPPAYTQPNQYSRQMLAPSPLFFGYPLAMLAQAIIDGYQWRITSISGMSGLTGVTANVWNNFVASTMTNGRLTFTGGSGSYAIEIREKTTGTVVGSFTYTITGA